ncbi:MAG: glutamate formimidoyltransferase [Holophaga sp.]|nr:glutamate formimidoyltransferase [Holophaga sp.]
MTKIISVVPNISEGRDTAFIEDLQRKLQAVPGLVLLDVAMDQARNRTVLSFTGSKDAIFQGGFVLYEETLKRVDMREHQGEYPRIGAVDAFPFVVVKDATIEEAVVWSTEFAEEVARRFELPTYLAYESARHAQRRDIENIRDGEYEGFAAKMSDPAWKPDFGPETFPIDKGATIIGARFPLVNFKVYLNTANEEAAVWVANTLSSPTTGLPNVKFYPGLDRQRNLALLNITVGNYQATPLYRVIEAIKTELRRFGANISKVETIGLVPSAALVDSALHYLQVTDFDNENLLEKRLNHVVDARLGD